MLRTIKLLALVAMFFVALTSSAQVTNSALSGVVADENQQAMIGATITVLHPPSGTEFNAVSNMDGRYTIQGVRPYPQVQFGEEKKGMSTEFIIVLIVILFVVLAIATPIVIAVIKKRKLKLNFNMQID